MPGPTGSGGFGTQVTALPNGNIVITDPYFDTRDGQDTGAVHLYNGATGALISTMTGTRANDNVGSEGVTVLSDGDFLVRSQLWDNGSAADASALTRCSMTAGCPGAVTASNSLVGTATGDRIGLDGVTILPNGNYIVVSPYWDKPFSADVGAVTWCHKTAGCPLGPVTSSNSLIGSKANDKIGLGGLYPLANGNYVVRSPAWDNFSGIEGGAGAVTWGNGTTGISGVVSAANSLVGNHSGDGVGFGVFALPSGNYVVSSPSWDNGQMSTAGAATFCNGNTGTSGPITAANSLVGSKPGDSISNRGITILTNGNYVVASSGWDNGTIQGAGAATWGSGTAGVTGTVNPSNSLVGTHSSDFVGMREITALTNGNYVVNSDYWHNGASQSGAVTWGNGATGTFGPVSETNSLVGSPEGGEVGYPRGAIPLTNGNYVVCSPFWIYNGASVGAATWADGTTGISGLITPANSLVGSTANDRVCDSLVALTNGNYVVVSPNWNSDAGSVTWGNGMKGISGTVSSANSLTGTYAQDKVGSKGVIALTNGNYVVNSPRADNVFEVDAGAVTWGNGTTGIPGMVGEANSLVGTRSGDLIGEGGVTALPNGNYVVSSPHWSTRAGAATWANGSTGLSGAVTTANSLVGSAENDYVSYFGITPLASGNYIVKSPFWDNAGIDAAGAVSKGNGSIGTKGFINPGNSVLGITPSGGVGQNFVFDAVNNQYVIGRPADNIVTLWRIATSATVSGKVTDANGIPIRNAIVSLTAPGGQRIAVQTGSMGLYLFENVPTGQAYTVGVSSKRYRFNLPQPVFIDADLANLDIMARPQEF